MRDEVGIKRTGLHHCYYYKMAGDTKKKIREIKYNYVVGRYSLIYIHFVYFYNLAAEDGGRIATSWNGMSRCI